MTWTGCYFGGNIGGAFGDASLSGPSGTVSTDGSGFAGGGQIGCDYQFSGGWVVGIRNMFDGTSNKRSGTIASGPLAGDVVNFNNQWFDTLTARLGYAFQPAWLLYLQGGAAWGLDDRSAALNCASTASRLSASGADTKRTLLPVSRSCTCERGTAQRSRDGSLMSSVAFAPYWLAMAVPYAL
jgi:opacity protein-like surface antigen